MKKGLLIGILGLISISLFASEPSQTINGVNLYKPGFFPEGRMLRVNDLTSMPLGTWQEKVYLTEPVAFKDNGESDGKGCFDYTAKVSHTFVGNLYAKIVTPDAAKALLKIKIPYKAPIYSGTVYKFTNTTPLTVISKKSAQDSDGKNYAIYECVYEGYLSINGITYPN